MKWVAKYNLVFLGLLVTLAFGIFVGTTSAATQVLVLELEGPIGPASSDFIVRGIAKAEETRAEAVIIQMNTPGGLDSSMRDIIKKILTSTIPVVTFVFPSGSRAASAGTYILYASHIAAMAPATNLGAATPVQLAPQGLPGGGKEKGPEPVSEKDNKSKKEDLKDQQDKDAGGYQPGSAIERKIVNDAVAYIRGLAKMRNRNVEWAEKAVREGVSLTAQDALAAKIVDLVVTDLDELLEKIDGREVDVVGNIKKLETKDAQIEVVKPDWLNRVLGIITNPNVAYILMLLGVYGLFFELSNPGNVLPGVAGAICLLLAFYALQVLPVDYAGVALILVGIAFMVGEMFVSSFGALGIGGVIAFIIGSMILMDTNVEAFELSTPLVVSVAVITSAFFMGVVAMAIKQRRRPVVSGREELLGNTGQATEAFSEEGIIHIHGENWRARSPHPVAKEQTVKVLDVDGLVLIVEPLTEEN